MESVRCIRCGQPGDDATIAVDLDNGEIYCHGCSERYTVADVEAAIGAWARLLPWLKAHPALAPQCGAERAA